MTTNHHEIAVTVCRHLHRLEWAAPAPRTWPCVNCQILAIKLTEEHGTQ